MKFRLTEENRLAPVDMAARDWLKSKGKKISATLSQSECREFGLDFMGRCEIVEAEHPLVKALREEKEHD